VEGLAEVFSDLGRVEIDDSFVLAKGVVAEIKDSRAIAMPVSDR
jgi:hypothetical protein